jgi:hypothetical protein
MKNPLISTQKIKKKRIFLRNNVFYQFCNKKKVKKKSPNATASTEISTLNLLSTYRHNTNPSLFRLSYRSLNPFKIAINKCLKVVFFAYFCCRWWQHRLS